MENEIKTQERVDGATPNGGVYSVAYFYDAQGKPCDKSRCFRMVISEYSASDDVLQSTSFFKEPGA